VERCIQDRLEIWDELIADGLVVLQFGRIEVTELGKGFVRNICMTLDPLNVPTETPTFSQTI
jgi:oxygen-independent coproporphyrinogen-3 oxidase